MDPITITTAAIAAVGLGMSIIGMNDQQEAQQRQNAAQQQIIAGQREAEAIRMKQMELDATRRRREILRQSIAARSQALAVATAQGAARGSGLQGGFGQISGRTGVNALGVSQALELGRLTFAANEKVFAGRSAYAAAGGDVATAAGLTSLGGAIMSNAPALGRISGQVYTDVSSFARGASGQYFTNPSTYPAY